jgi:hypothetical protein
MSKSSIAVIVLAILLALSMVLGLTGAWFTSKDDADADTTIKFGTVAIDVSETTTGTWTSDSTVEGELMPGDSYAAVITLKNTGSQDVYYKYTVVAKFYAKSDANKDNALEIEGVKLSIDDSKVGTAVSDGIYALKTGVSVTFPASMELDTSLNNTYQGEEYVVVFTVSVEAVQQANFNPATDTWPTDFTAKAAA